MTTEPYPVYPLGMAVCSAALTRRGHLVRQFDYLASEKSDDELVTGLEEFKPDFVCLSLRNIDNIDSHTSDRQWYLDSYKQLVDTARGVGGVPVIVGGPGFSIMPEKILEYVGADYGVKGEGEQAICTLIRDLENGEDTPPVISGSTVPLEGLEMVSPLYEKKLVDYYIDKSDVINLHTKRGCPYRCIYCTYPSLEGNRFRPRDPGAVVDDIQRLQRDYNVNDLFFTDSVFNDSEGHHLELVEEILRREIKINWAAFFTPRNSNSKELALMKRSGLNAVELGTDAGCDRTLAGLGKDFTFDHVMNFNAACVENEIPCGHFIIFGGPNENESTIIEALENIEKLEYCVVLGFSGIRILPGTAMHRRAVEDGLIEPGDPLLKPKYYISPEIDYDRMNMMIKAGFKGRRDRVFPPEECSARIAIVKNFGVKGILWNKLIRFPGERRKNG